MSRKVLFGISVIVVLLAADASFAQAPPSVKLCVQIGPLCVPVNSSNPLPISGSFSATLGGFSPNGTYTSLTATASSSVSTSLSGLGTTVRFTNLGSGTVSCTFSTGSATGVVNNTQIGPSSSVSRVIGTFTSVACIDQTGSSGSQLVILEGGSGLGNDTGGGGGGGGSSGAVFGPTAVGSAAANPPVLMGGTANGTATGNVAVAEIKTASSAVVGDPAVVVSDPMVASALNTGIRTPPNVTPTDCSGTISTGGTAQVAIAAQTTLHGFFIGNIDSAHNDEVLWTSFTTTAAAQTAGSYPLAPPTATTFASFGSFTTPPRLWHKSCGVDLRGHDGPCILLHMVVICEAPGTSRAPRLHRAMGASSTCPIQWLPSRIL